MRIASLKTAFCGIILTLMSTLPLHAQNTVTVSTAAELLDAVNNLTSNTTVLIADGVYTLTFPLYVGTDYQAGATPLENIVFKSQSGNREAVIIEGPGMLANQTPHFVFKIYHARNVTIQDMTLRDVWYHLIQVHGEQGADEVYIKNLHLIDAKEQAVKVSFSTSTPDLHADDGIIEECLIELTNISPDNGYTGAADMHAAQRWIIRNNIFKNYYHPSILVHPVILVWSGGQDTIVENNLFFDCDRGVYFGGGPPGSTDQHVGGIIKNNIFHRLNVPGDVAISITSSSGAKVYNNTVVQPNFKWSIEVRYVPPSGNTNADIRYNVCTNSIVERDGATSTQTGNIVGVDQSWFVDYNTGDLHLTADATPLIDQAAALSDVLTDYDLDVRPQGTLSDIGADEYIFPSSLQINDIRIVNDAQYAQNPVTKISYTANAGTTYTVWARDSLQSPFVELGTHTPASEDAVFVDQGGGTNGFDHPSQVSMRFYKITE